MKSVVMISNELISTDHVPDLWLIDDWYDNQKFDASHNWGLEG